MDEAGRVLERVLHNGETESSIAPAELPSTAFDAGRGIMSEAQPDRAEGVRQMLELYDEETNLSCVGEVNLGRASTAPVAPVEFLVSGGEAEHGNTGGRGSFEVPQVRPRRGPPIGLSSESANVPENHPVTAACFLNRSKKLTAGNETASVASSARRIRGSGNIGRASAGAHLHVL